MCNLSSRKRNLVFNPYNIFPQTTRCFQRIFVATKNFIFHYLHLWSWQLNQVMLEPSTFVDIFGTNETGCPCSWSCWSQVPLLIFSAQTRLGALVRVVRCQQPLLKFD